MNLEYYAKQLRMLSSSEGLHWTHWKVVTLGGSPCEDCLCLGGDMETWTDRLSEKREYREADERGGGLKRHGLKDHMIELWREAYISSLHLPRSLKLCSSKPL